uniref:DNA cross-link repair 1A protein n=1 Tax=Myotis lucifugus TaxID=59463 RepID=G1Q4Z6_MYOLU
MLEDTFSEEDIWEYKSKRKPKPVHNIPKSVEKATDGKYRSKRNRNKRKTVEAKEKAEDPEECLGVTGSQTSIASSQGSSCGDGTQQSQGKTTPGKHCRAHKTKQVSPKIRPVYDGYCPNCQMPFSALLGQTPRWHVFECLDSPPLSETECPDGLLCTSTIPSHYKRYTHLLLAQSRAGHSPLSSPSHGVGGSFSETNSGFLCSLEESWSPDQKQTENFKHVSIDPLFVTQCLKKSQSPTETKKKISSSTNIQTSQRAPQATQCVHDDKLVGAGWPLAGRLDSQNNSGHTNLLWPENDLSDCEISYSPLQSDEETYDIDEKLDDSQQELFFTESSKDGSLEADDNSCTLFKNVHCPLLRSQQESGSEMNSFLTQERYNEELYTYSTLNDPSQLLFPSHDPAYSDDGFLLFPPALAGGLASSSCQATTAKPDEPEVHASPSNKQKQIIEASAVYNHISLPLLKSKMPKPFESQAQGGCLSSHPTQTTSAKSLKMLPSGSQCSATQTSTKVMKQMDIGVYFGLPPKRKEEKSVGESALEGMNSSPVVSPNKKRPRQCKRKAENSLSDSELDAKNLNSPQEGTPQSRLQRGNRKSPYSSPAGELRKRTCPFYKKIPGTGFTVDAFQYGVVEGCTAYFLTHFHSDHYAGLSKNSTFPVYCSEITGNLLKSKLHVEEQYIHPLPMDTECIVNGIKVVLLDANHCPGAVMILFYLPNGNVVLHTGDFRADPTMERSLLKRLKVHTLYLDTTYCSPEYCFPSQQEVIQFAINTAFEAVTLNPRTLVVCGTYSIGKEKVFLAIADVIGSKVGMSREKYKTLQCLNIPEINSLITTDMCNTLVHLLPMMQINFKGLQSHLKKYDGRYEQILAFRPTGWTHSNKLTSITDVVPQTKGNISIYGIPYSEHSSYLEMKRFVQWLKPQKIIPTVNVGSWKSRHTMEEYFKEWKLEAGY